MSIVDEQCQKQQYDGDDDQPGFAAVRASAHVCAGAAGDAAGYSAHRAAVTAAATTAVVAGGSASHRAAVPVLTVAAAAVRAARAVGRSRNAAVAGASIVCHK